MFCSRCGTKLEEGAFFCTNCGARASGETEDSLMPQHPKKKVPKLRRNRKDKKESKKVLAAGLIALTVIAVLVGAFLMIRPERRLVKVLDLGNKYLLELDYEQAVVAFAKAIEIDPMNADAYLGLVEAHIGSGNYEEALDAARKGYELTNDGRLREKIGSILDMVENRTFMKKTYDLMAIEDYDSMRNAGFSEEMAAFVDRMEGDRAVYFPENVVGQTGVGLGVYKFKYYAEQNEENFYFYYGGFVDGVRTGNGTSFYILGAYGRFDDYELFIGKWERDAPNGKGKLIENYTGDMDGGVTFVTEGNFTDGLSDGYMKCILSDWYGYGEDYGKEFDLSYSARKGTPEDITDRVHEIDLDSRRNNYIYAHCEKGYGDSRYLSLNSNKDKVGVFGFAINHEMSWKDAYVQHIYDKRYDAQYGDDFDSYIYKLVNIDGDDIPELYIDFNMTAKGAVLCSFYKGSVIEQGMWTWGFSYIESENLFMDAGGHMGEYWHDIYSIRDGEFVLRSRGECRLADFDDIQFDPDGNMILEYFWNGKKVSSRSEYEALCNEIYDSQKAVHMLGSVTYDAEAERYVGDEIYNFEEILERIENY